MDEILWRDHLNETSCIVLVVLFVLYVVLNFESVDRIPWCDHSNETSLVVFPHDTVCFSAFYKKKKKGPLLEVSGLRLRQLTVVVIVVLFRVRWMFLSVTLQHFRKLTCPRVWDLRSVLMLHSLCSMLCRLT